MKKIAIGLLCAFSAVLVSMLGIVFGEYLKISLKPYYVTDLAISVPEVTTLSANMHQNNAYVDILPVDGKLYFFVNCWPGSLGKRSKFDRKLCAIENGTINVLQNATLVYGHDNRFIYCKLGSQLIAHNTQLNQSVILTSDLKDLIYDATMDSDGTLKLFPKNKSGDCYVVKDGKLVETSPKAFVPVQYEIGGKQYYVQNQKLYCQGNDISEQIGPASFRALIPYRDGLLLINDGYGSLVHYIQEDGTILPLFPEFACMCSTSSVNFYDNYIFVSFKRWESYDESGIGLKSFEGDGLEGTYRIDIKDMSIEKISDNIYNGMFVFDDSGIYACNREGDIHQIDFNGNLIQTIVD